MFGVATVAVASAKLIQGQEHPANTPATQQVFDVNVMNNSTASVPTREVNSPAHDPWDTRVYPNPSQAATFTVPPHKRLVITNICAFDNGGAGSTVNSYEIDFRHGAFYHAFNIPVTQRYSEYSYASATAPLSLVADPGTLVYVNVIDSNNNDHSGMNVDLSGYLVDEQGYYLNNGY